MKINRRLKLKPGKKIIILRSDKSYAKNNVAQICPVKWVEFRHSRPFSEYYYIVYGSTDKYEKVIDKDGNQFNAEVFEQCRIEAKSKL